MAEDGQLSRIHANGCEHGDHPAPAGKRFCSLACQRCEHESNNETGCEALCFFGGHMDATNQIDCLARAAHEVNRAYCLAIGDDSQPPWDGAPEWQKSSARNGVIAVLAALMAGEAQRPEASHEGWMAEKLANGWKYGPVKDPEKKEHPCMVPYTELPPEQRAKDHLFIATVTKMAEQLKPAS